MQKVAVFPAVFLCLGIFVSLDAAQYYDEPLSDQCWSEFGPLCKHYVAGRREKPEAVYELLKGRVNPEAAILDLGSGTGISTRQLFKCGFKHVIGVDRDAMMIKEAQAVNCKDCTIKYIRADVSKGLPFPDEEFDVVTASSAFHWFSNPSSIQEVARILKSHGYYYVIGARGRTNPVNEDAFKRSIRQIFEEEGIPPKPNKNAMSTASALEAQGFKIIVDEQIPYVEEYSKQEFLERIQSQTRWNLVKDSQRDQVLKKIDHYLDSVITDNGKLRQAGQVTVILAQKNEKTLVR